MKFPIDYLLLQTTISEMYDPHFIFWDPLRNFKAHVLQLANGVKS